MRRFCTLDHGNHYQTILAVGSPRLLMPFAGQSIAKAAMVGDDRIFCLAQDGACCLLDWRSGLLAALAAASMKHGELEPHAVQAAAHTVAAAALVLLVLAVAKRSVAGSRRRAAQRGSERRRSR